MNDKRFQPIEPFENPPLIYVLGMVRIGRLPTLEDNINKVFEGLRSEYPLLGEADPVTSYQVNINSGAVEKKEQIRQWIMTSADSRSGIIFREDAVFFHTTDYKGFDEFFSPIKTALELLNKEIGLTHVGQLGYRYVNRIIDSDATPINEILKDNFFGIDLETENELLISSLEKVCETDLGRIRLVGIQSSNGKQNSMLGEIAETYRFLKKNEELMDGENAVLLDIDHHLANKELRNYDMDNLENTLDKLHVGARNVFFACIKEEAVNKWK